MVTEHAGRIEEKRQSAAERPGQPLTTYFRSNLVATLLYKTALQRAFVINRKIVNTAIGRDVRSALARFPIPVLKTAVCQRVAFAESAQGMTVFDLEQNGPASRQNGPATREIRSLVEEVMQLVK
jgi:chromosome partitioning protein